MLVVAGSVLAYQEMGFILRDENDPPDGVMEKSSGMMLIAAGAMRTPDAAVPMRQGAESMKSGPVQHKHLHLNLVYTSIEPTLVPCQQAPDFT